MKILSVRKILPISTNLVQLILFSPNSSIGYTQTADMQNDIISLKI